jgi:hypothetical protein
MEVKKTNDKYPWYASGYKIFASKAMSHNQGGVALLWKDGHASFEVEAATVITLNLLTFQLFTGYNRFYIMGIYIPPNDSMEVDDLWMAWAACPDNCIPMVLGDLNINFEHPRDYCHEQNHDLLDKDKINLLDLSWKFSLCRC